MPVPLLRTGIDAGIGLPSYRGADCPEGGKRRLIRTKLPMSSHVLRKGVDQYSIEIKKQLLMNDCRRGAASYRFNFVPQ